MAAPYEPGSGSAGLDARDADVRVHPERAADVAERRGKRQWSPLAEAELSRDVAREGQARFAFLADASRRLAKSLDYETTLTTVAGLALPHFGAWCVVDVCEPDDSIRRLAVIHPDPGKQALAEELHGRYPPSRGDPVGAPRVIRTRRPEVVLDIPEEALAGAARDPEHLALLRGLGLRSCMTVPMLARGRVLGAITFATADVERRYGMADVILAEDLALRCALAIDNVRLLRDAEAQRIRADAARADAEAANRAKSGFLTIVSQELRTPLDTISGCVQLMAAGHHGPLTRVQREDLAVIGRSQRHLLSLIKDVLTFAEVESRRDEFALADIPVYEIVAEAQALMAPTVASQGMAYQPTRCDPTLVVHADRERLRQILVHLLSNAVKFTERGGTIALTCERAERALAIRVSDTGSGIPAERIETLFEPFVHIHHGSVGVTDGTRVGLAISRELARAMGGDLTANSAVGQGSTFTLTLPCGAGQGSALIARSMDLLP